MAIGQGFKSYIQFGLESTYGTAVAATDRLEIISMDVGPDQSVILDPSLNNSVGRRGLSRGACVSRAPIVMPSNSKGLLKLGKALGGARGPPTLVEAATSLDH